MRYLIKIGSALINRKNRIDTRWLQAKVAEIAALKNKGGEILLVSSGAVAAGMEIENLSTRPRDTLKLQLLSGIGQIRLMKYYKDCFKEHRIVVAQILLTHHNFDSSNEEKSITAIMNAYLDQGTIPIVNENDMVNKEEVEYKPIFSDNDILAALVAVRLKVDLLLILTDVDGLFRGDPKEDTGAELIETVELIDERIKDMASKESNPLGLGGMHSKVEAAEIAGRQGIDTIVANGHHALEDILEQRVQRTLFRAGP